MLQNGIIAPSVSPYASPITLVTKRDKTKRFCIDYRNLNEIIAPDVHPLPLIETILDKLSKAKYYSSVDIASAYWQVEVEPNSRNLLAFVTLDSQYEFCRLPYGFKNSPQIYHRAINQVMQKYKLNFVTHYFDDFIIFSDTLEDHLQHLQQFLAVCQHENIKLNYNKCSFFKTNIDFLGYTVTAGTYAPQTRNLDTINAIKPPTNQKTLQSFLGAVNVYNKFIPDYARLRAPLNKLLKKDVKWNWDPDCQQAFTTLKESLTSKPVLHLYQVGLPCRLYCDASTQGIADILKQVHPDGQVHPVQYFSRALRAHERNYTVSELECLAIVESVDKFRIYLTGIKFTIYTDHQALQWLKTIKKNPSGRLFIWSLRLSTYNYEIHYLKGSQQYEADLLSRNPFVGFVSADIIKQHQPTASPFNIDTNGLHTITRKGVIKIIIPETLQHTLMNKVHQEYNHPDISQMTRIITAQYYWKCISKSIEKFVKSCHTCQIIKMPKGKPYGALGQIPPPQQPFDLISIDTIAGISKYGHSKTYLHVIVDHLTRYAWTFPSKSTSTLTYIQTLKTVLQQGSPKRLLSDRAPAFTSEKFRKFLITHGIQPLLTTSNNPQANGLIERLNATITGKLRLAYPENPKASWTQLVKRVTQTCNNTPHSVTSFPPTYLMFNVIPPDLRTHLNPYPEINTAREIASSRTQNKHKKDKETFDKQHRTPHFEVNDLVLVKNYRHPDTGKLAPYFTGPYTIIEIISPNFVRINRPNQPLNRDSDTIHVNKLKYYTENVLYITPPQPRFVQNPQRLPQNVYLSEFNHLTPDIFETQLFRIIPPTSSQPFLHLNPENPCGNEHFTCSNSQCIKKEWWCDGRSDCRDNSDEARCRHTYNYYTGCQSDQFDCKSPKQDRTRCIPMEWTCDARPDCTDGSDEKLDRCIPKRPCTSEEFKCHNGLCIPMSQVCDGTDNCRDNSDENCWIQLPKMAIGKEMKNKLVKYLSLQNPPLFFHKDPHRYLLTLFFANNSAFNSSLSPEMKLLVKEVDLETTMVLYKNQSEHLDATDLALYIHSQLALCSNPRNFFGTDLVSLLERKVEKAAPGSFNPLVSLSLCNSGVELSSQHLDNI
ncbi:hypothetical protein LAZ67_5003330 [Cordylochernes scorpioides]|uniref:RNA-directed DNA polymerase n=1 Tax=Cordylochernes scorpioides TaxID=51811 RepID=A0ABY6KK61_9ARAC|nr:hypothetical protein LAZ67_5003330 [Cordylochernes scorpioides]